MADIVPMIKEEYIVEKTDNGVSYLKIWMMTLIISA